MFCSPPLVVSLCLLGGRIRVYFVGYVLRKLIWKLFVGIISLLSMMHGTTNIKMIGKLNCIGQAPHIAG